MTFPHRLPTAAFIVLITYGSHAYSVKKAHLKYEETNTSISRHELFEYSKLTENFSSFQNQTIETLNW